jgi:type II secretory pathway pseudopilin PulG
MIYTFTKFKFQAHDYMRGFTILETILSIAVVSLAIAGATSAVRTGLIGSSLAKEQVQAFYLAQEAIEIIRNKRDANVLATYNNTPTNWLAGIALAGDPCHPANFCTVDAYTFTLTNVSTSGCTSWSAAACPFLRQNPDQANLVYGYNGAWNATQFKRIIQIESISADEVSVSIQISWTHGTMPRSFTTKTTLMNWFGSQ